MYIHSAVYLKYLYIVSVLVLQFVVIMELENPQIILEKIKSGEFQLRRKLLTSKVWAIFAKIVNQDGEEIDRYAYCTCCENLFKHNKLSTSNLLKHKCYIKKFVKPKDAEEEHVDTTETDAEPKNNISVVEEEIKPMTSAVEYPDNPLTTLLTKWIIKSCRPSDLLQNRDLKSILQEAAILGSRFGGDLNVNNLFPSSSHVARNLSEIYNQSFEKVKAEIASIKERGFSLTADVWNDHFTRESYIALTIHYIKNDVLTFRLLGLKTFEDDLVNRDENIAEKVTETLNDFNCKLSNESLLVTKEDNIKYFRNTRNLPCISQLLNNAIEKSIAQVPGITEMLSACSKLIQHLTKINLHTLFDISSLAIHSGRWQSAYKMLNSLENSYWEIQKTLRNRNESTHISSINFSLLKAVIKTLQPFDEAIETFEDSNHPTLHLVLVYLHELKKLCDTNDSEFKDLDFIEELKKNLRLSIEKIVAEKVTILHKLALFLYPPTNKLLQFSDNEKKSTEEECLRLIKNCASELKPKIKEESSESSSGPVLKRRKWFSDFVPSEAKQDANERIIQEIQCYKNTFVVNSADFDVFSWWNLQKGNFPLLYKLSCTVLATPASNASSRYYFSTAQSLLHERLKYGSSGIDVEKMLFVKTNAEHDEIDEHFSI